MKSTILRFAIASIAICFASCVMTTRKTKNPTYSTDTKSLSKQINGMMASQEINIHGLEIKSNGELTSELTIELINPKRKLADTNLLRDIGKEIAVLIKRSLKDPADYNSYSVLMINQTNDGAVTKSTYTQHIYKSDELNNNVYIITLGDKFDSSAYMATGKTTFDRNDSVITSVISYYYFEPKPALSIKAYKEVDTGVIRAFKNDVGFLQTGSNYECDKLGIGDFYKIKQLGPGKYRLEYWLGDEKIGQQFFNLL